MKGKLVDSRPVAGAWIYEIKIEGYRALATSEASRIA
jgi:hypothetical protein